MSTTYTLVSWVTIFGVAAAGYYVYSVKPAQARRASFTKVSPKFLEKKKEPKKAKKVQKDEPTKEAGVREQKQTETTYSIVDSKQEELDDKNFARELQNAKEGKLAAPKSKDDGRQRSIKQGKAQEKQTKAQEKKVQEKPAQVEEASSDNGTGADADDDRSSVNSPELDATTAINGDVSDMLEAPASGPSVLRVTAPTIPVVPKKAKAAAAPQPTETKRQRQNRQKTEQKKLEREAEEKERKKKEEAQRRTAREAAGIAAKDGSAFMAARGPSSSAWTGPKTNGDKNEAPKADLLDTYTPQASTPQEATPSESSSDWQKVAAEMSEEEQMRRFNDDDSWTVQEKKRKPKPSTKESNDDSSDAAPPAREQVAPKRKENVKPAVQKQQKQQFAGLEVEREAEQEESEEWDV